jgi:hypothetical protein
MLRFDLVFIVPGIDNAYGKPYRVAELLINGFAAFDTDFSECISSFNIDEVKRDNRGFEALLKDLLRLFILVSEEELLRFNPSRQAFVENIRTKLKDDFEVGCRLKNDDVCEAKQYDEYRKSPYNKGMFTPPSTLHHHAPFV